MKLFTSLSLGMFFLILCAFRADRGTFEEVQKNFPRVSDAYERKEELLLMKCRTNDVSENFGNMFLRVFKQESIMEVWVQNTSGRYIKFNEYKIYAMSGRLGPKRREGDCQVPEGFYAINEFNPSSNYHLSLGINYPNEADMKLSDAEHKGRDIFIHGGQASAGCMAMSNYYIEDIYIYAVKAHNQGEAKIPVQIFPFKMSAENMRFYCSRPEFKQHHAFWNNLAEGYNFFEKTNRVPDIYVDARGKYHFVDPRSAQATNK
jgi:murein L,D-transpeptidase YafK